MINETTVSWLEIPYITLTFCLRFLKPSEVPEQKVSALRGGLGEMLLRKNCVADRNCDECRFQDSCIVWNAFYTPMRFKPAYMTGKESLGYLIEGDNQETDMDPRCSANIWMRFGSLDRPESEKIMPDLKSQRFYQKMKA